MKLPGAPTAHNHSANVCALPAWIKSRRRGGGRENYRQKEMKRGIDKVRGIGARESYLF